ncbi:hypothetical protein PNA2_1817 [Pyrococcus sp. NA2]|uniref:CRISPR-associated endonuclease Cas3'' n=1 Tax=Pyrococcus sp. (strain NA2) TaxID=342949 RepID=UPI000209AC0E|nr:CRISPR-associated endonuclease Cas3'' [Pyrococcus sp. NA2]AEC52732.1 hypothetical protein PNA2_1817 [Pyrococcus sp. NA2]
MSDNVLKECEAFPGQTLKEHVEEMLSAWDMVKSKYILSIIRVMRAVGIELKEKDADRFMRALIILHDIGKCSRIYQNYLEGKEELGGFRHELVSAYYTYEILKRTFESETLAFIGALVVMMHHEPILMGQILSLQKENLSPEVVIDKLRNFDGIVDGTESLLKELMEKYLNVDLDVPKPTKEDILDRITSLSVLARHGSEADKLRLVVGALLIPLVLCDYKGAESREGETPKFAEILEVEMIV